MVETVALAADVRGDGPALVLAHGFGHDRHYWSAQLRALEPRYHLVAVDLRGHGRSPAPVAGYGASEYAADVLALLDRLGAGMVHWCGTHTGASVGLLLAAEWPERIASLILEGAVIPGVPVPAVEWAQARARELAVEQGPDAARVWWLNESGFFDAIARDPETHRCDEHAAMIARFSCAPWLAGTAPAPVPDVVGRLRELRQPVMLINGAGDLPDFHATADTLARELRNVRRIVIPGAGAFPAWERPDAVTPLIDGFLSEF